MLSCQFQKLVVAVGIVDAGHLCYNAVIVRGSFLQLLGHSHHPSDEHRTITASNAMLDSRRTHVRGHQEDRVSIRYCGTFGARRPPSSQALPSDQVSHENQNGACSLPGSRDSARPGGRRLEVGGSRARGIGFGGFGSRNAGRCCACESPESQRAGEGTLEWPRVNLKGPVQSESGRAPVPIARRSTA
jgi:hypothetical protein